MSYYVTSKRIAKSSIYKALFSTIMIMLGNQSAWSACVGPNANPNPSRYDCSGSSTYTNTGSISGVYTGAGNNQVVGNTGSLVFNNSGQIVNSNPFVDSNHYNFGVFNDGSMDFTNSGTIQATTSSVYSNTGVRNAAGGNISNFVNSGTITGSRSAIENIGQIDDMTLTSSSVLTGDAIFGLLTNFGTITNFTNNSVGSILPGAANRYGFLLNYMTITNLTNNGTISGVTSAGLRGSGIYNEGTIDHLVNTGTINGDVFDQNYTVNGGGGGILNLNYAGAVITTLDNSGTIGGGIVNVGGQIGTLNNTGGTITANGTSAAIVNAADYYFVGDNATISTITNTGTISGGADYGIMNQDARNGSPGVATIDSLVNRGTITGSYGIYNGSNDAVLTLLANGQGVGNNAGALTYTGKLPVNYSVILNASNNYGRVAFTNPSGATAFGIYTGSTVTQATYTSVISGIANASSFTTSSGTYGGYDWNLVQQGLSSVWDLIFSNYVASVNTGTDTNTNENVYNATVALRNSPALNAARVIDASPDLTSLFSGLSGNTAISNAVSQTLPGFNGGQAAVVQSSLHDVNRVVQARQSENSGLSSGNATLDRNFWIKPFASWTEQDGHNGVSGYSADTQGFVVGADKLVTGNDRLGIAFAYSSINLDAKASSAPQSSDVDSYQAIVYGSRVLDRATEFNYQADLGVQSNDNDRTLSFTGQTATSDYTSYNGHAGVGLGRVYRLIKNSSVTPSMRLDYAVLHNNSYREDGAGSLNLSADDDTFQELIPSADLKFVHNINNRADVSFNVGAGYDVINQNAKAVSSFAGAPSTSFSTPGIDPSPWIGRAGVGLMGRLTDDLEIGVRYDAELRERFDNQTASIKARWSF